MYFLQRQISAGTFRYNREIAILRIANIIRIALQTGYATQFPSSVGRTRAFIEQSSATQATWRLRAINLPNLFHLPFAVPHRLFRRSTGKIRQDAVTKERSLKNTLLRKLLANIQNIYLAY